MPVETGDLRPTRARRLSLTSLRAALGDVGEWVGPAETVGAIEVGGLSLSSQRIAPADLYAALPGARAHGADYARDAVTAGAAAILTDAGGADRVRSAGLAVGIWVVPDPRAVLGALAAEVYGRPADRLTLLGVTGTQGKTTTTRLAEGALLAAGVPAGVIGTVGTRVRGRDLATALTTPEAPDLHGLFARMLEQDVEVCAMEVSSHALVMGRVDGVRFDVAAFTNLGRDHLDFHDDLEDYFAAKASLFTPDRATRGLANLDDAHGRRLLESAAIPMRSFSADPQAGGQADWRAVDLAPDRSGTDFTVLGPEGVEVRTRVGLAGSFNVANALCALACCGEAGLDVTALAGALGRSGVPGRLEEVAVAGSDITAVVDYAHKPDAVEAALRALRPVTEGRLVVVIGAGGDRDRGKRAVMGEIAARLADLVVVTDDNPRSEDPAAIRAEILRGAGGGRAEVVEIGDRRAAVATAVADAGAGDTVLVAGKGHETGQEVDGTVHPFDDRVVVREALEARLAGTGESR